MPNTILTWKLVDDVAAELGATEASRLKWRQPGRGVPDAWRIRIYETLTERGEDVSFDGFSQLEVKPGRIAA